MRKISLNVSKSIGKVVFIVEGDKKEHSFLGHIFMNILDYSIVEVKRKRAPYEKYVKMKIYWRCSECSNVWQSSVNSRVHGTNCPICAKLKRVRYQ